MSDRDRGDQESQADRLARRDARDRERGSARQGRMSADDQDIDNVPSWAGDPDSGTGRSGPDRSKSGRSRGGEYRDPIPQLGDAFRRSQRGAATPRSEPAVDDARDPYDRLRRVASRPPRTVEFDDEIEPTIDRPWEDDDFDRRVPRPRRRASAGGGRPRRPPASKQLGGMLSAAEPQVRFVIAIAGLAVLSLILMSSTVAGRTASLPGWMPIHLDAQGNPDLWGTPATIWRIPLMTGMLTVMSAVVAWFTNKSDPFAARFALGTILLVHTMSWIGLVALVW